MKKPNDHAEPTKSRKLKTKKQKNCRVDFKVYDGLYSFIGRIV